jgi:hypothetical protein
MVTKITALQAELAAAVQTSQLAYLRRSAAAPSVGHCILVCQTASTDAPVTITVTTSRSFQSRRHRASRRMAAAASAVLEPLLLPHSRQRDAGQ